MSSSAPGYVKALRCGWQFPKELWRRTASWLKLTWMVFEVAPSTWIIPLIALGACLHPHPHPHSHSHPQTQPQT